MEYKEIESILETILEKEDEIYEKPTSEEWNKLSQKLNCSFSDEFRSFIELMSKWSFPGDIYNVGKNHNNGNDTIEDVYCHEISNGNWDRRFIPFYGIGNGDYFCLSNFDSKVYYYFDDTGKIDKYCDSFEMWIEDLPNFLA